jgi:NAD(P)-dependent dehydrogenase (short-subunit alcohol dehydrogenase family)
MDDNFLTNKIAVVTGAGRGLGEKTCYALAEAGATVVAADIAEPQATEVAQRITENGGKAVGHYLDVSNQASAASLMEEVELEFGKIDILINNAGIDLTTSVEEFPVEKWEQIIGVNLTGPFIMSQLAFRSMIESGQGGNIINICSTASKMAWPNASAYHASKWGLLGLSNALYTEGKSKNINVTAIIAGGMKTPFLLERFPELDTSLLQDPRTVAETIVYILSLPPEVVIPEIAVFPRNESSWY